MVLSSFCLMLLDCRRFCCISFTSRAIVYVSFFLFKMYNFKDCNISFGCFVVAELIFDTGGLICNLN